MNPFGFSIHHAFNEYTQSDLEKFFAGVKSKTAMFSYHAALTTKLHLKEKNEALDIFNKAFEIPLKEANEKYELLKKDFEDDNEGHQYAYHYSNLDQIEGSQSMGEYQLSEEFDDLSAYTNNSAIIEAYSFLEKEFKRLCELLKVEFSETISHNDLSSRDYLAGWLKYLRLVIKLNVTTLDPFINKFKDLQYIRNRIIHDGGEFPKNPESKEDKTNVIEKLVNSSKKRLELLEENNMFVIRIKDISYVQDYYDVILDFFQAILNLVEEKNQFKILRAKLRYLYSSLSDKAVIEIRSVKYKTSTFEIVFKVKFPRSKGLGRDMTVRILAKKLKQTPIYVSYTGPANDKIDAFAANIKTTNHILLNDVLYGYLIVHNRLQAEVFMSI